jgi:hypothetical protein
VSICRDSKPLIGRKSTRCRGAQHVCSYPDKVRQADAKAVLSFPQSSSFSHAILHVYNNMDCGGSDDEVRKQQYDHANGTECLVGSLEEEQGKRLAQPGESLRRSRCTKRPMAGRNEEASSLHNRKTSYISKPPSLALLEIHSLWWG